MPLLSGYGTKTASHAVEETAIAMSEGGDVQEFHGPTTRNFCLLHGPTIIFLSSFVSSPFLPGKVDVRSWVLAFVCRSLHERRLVEMLVWVFLPESEVWELDPYGCSGGKPLRAVSCLALSDSSQRVSCLSQQVYQCQISGWFSVFYYSWATEAFGFWRTSLFAVSLWAVVYGFYDPVVSLRRGVVFMKIIDKLSRVRVWVL